MTVNTDRPGTLSIVTKNGLGWLDVLKLASGIFLGLASVRFVWTFAQAFAVLALSVTIADAFEPLVGRVQRKMRRGWAVVVVYGCGALLLAVCVYVMVPALTTEIQKFTALLPSLIGEAQQFLNQGTKRLGVAGSFDLSKVFTVLSTSLVALPVSLATGAITSVLVIFLSLYWLLASPAILRFVRSLFPESRRGDLDNILSDMSRAMGGYLRGVALNGLALGALTWVALYLAGVNDAFVLAIITGLAEFFPYIGPILAAIPALLVALLQSPAKALITLIIYVALHQIEGHLLTPNIMRSQTNVPRPLVIIAVFAGGAVGGLLGAIVAIPIAGAAMVCVERLVVPAIRRRWDTRTQPH